MRWQSVAAGALTVLLSVSTSGSSPAPVSDSMFGLYERNRQEKIPNYVTEDFLLLCWSMALREGIAANEQNHALPELRSAVESLLVLADKAGDGAAEQSNRDYLRVIQHLLNGSEPGSALKAVAGELASVRRAAGPARSELLLQTIDYSQFRPRGHYTRSPELTRYFQAVRYAETALFYVKESAATGVDAASANRLTCQAMLLAKWIQDDPVVRDWYKRSVEERAWLFGPPEDLTIDDLLQVRSAQPSAPSAEWRVKLLSNARANGHQPDILSALVDVQRLEPGLTAKDALTGWRLLPASFTPDSAAEQQLVYPHVGKYLGTKKPFSLTLVNGAAVKGFPLGAEIMDLLGSVEAKRQLNSGEETNYEGYSKASAEAAHLIVRQAGLPSELLGLMSWWLSDSHGDAGTKLTTVLGLWTLSRHEMALYTKQSYTGTGKGMEPADPRPTAWLEPASQLYRRLGQLSAEASARLQAPTLNEYSHILEQCAAIAEDEASGHKLGVEQAGFLNDLDRRLVRFTGGPDVPVVIDVHTDVNSEQVLIEALRYPAVVVRPSGERGARFRVAEFKHPLSDRITDERWRQMLDEEPSRR
jgi:hypothetical protein